MIDVFTRADQMTPEWLTDCLREQGVLTSGHVTVLSGDRHATEHAGVEHVTVHYSDDAPLTAPRQLFLKTGVGDAADNEDWLAEVNFYTLIAPASASVVVPCYHAAYAPNPARFHVLLEDLTATHQRILWPLPPTLFQFGQAVNCLAQLHLLWWNHPRLGRDIQPRFTETTLDGWLPIWEQQLARFLDFLGDRLLIRRRSLYEWAMPRLLQRTLQRRQTGRHLTIAHQDAHAYNFLFPTDSTAQTTRLVDWATWDIDVGARDLAYLLALHCFPEQRAQIEQPLLHRYHERLLAGGVRDYDWDQLWADYRLSVIWNLFIPIEQFCWNVPAAIWWYHAERSVLAFDDLQCAELLA
jgi:thiamine kinase-like enzyme